MRAEVSSTIAALAVASAFILPTHAQTPSSHSALNVTFVNPGKTGEVFWDMVTDSMQAAGRSLDIKVEAIAAERNFRRMQEIGIEVVQRQKKPDFLILVNEESAAVPILEAAHEAGIKTLLLSNALVGEDAERLGGPRDKLDNWIGSLVPDMEAAGARMARGVIDNALAHKLQSEDGKVHLLAIGGDETTPVSVARQRGLDRAVSAVPHAVVERTLFANWNEADAEALAYNFLQWAQRKKIRIGGIWAANDPMALGAIKAAKRAGFTPGTDIGIVGLNWSPEALKKVEAGELVATDGGHFLQGALSIVLLRDYADGCDFARTSATRLFRTSSVGRDRAAAMHRFVTERQYGQIDFNALRPRTKVECGHYDFSADNLLNALPLHSGG